MDTVSHKLDYLKLKSFFTAKKKICTCRQSLENMKLDLETMQQQIPHHSEQIVKLNRKKKKSSFKISNRSPKQTLFKSKNDQHVYV